MPSLTRPGALSSLLAILLFFTARFASAQDVIESDSLNLCTTNSNETGFTPTYFQVAFTPNNNTLYLNFQGNSEISGNVTVGLSVSAYGYTFYNEKVNPCTSSVLTGLCPLVAGPINIPGNIPLSASATSQIPGIAYTIPDLDGAVQIRIYDNSGGPEQGTELTCLQADLSNGKTVYSKGVGWATAVVAGVALLVSAIVSGLGHSNTAAHVAANALSLFGFFQTQALFGMTAVTLPPIVMSWTQNFQWSIGIIRVGFVESICTWYQRATGGTPSQLLNSLSTTSVNVQKRSLDLAHQITRRSLGYISRAEAYMNSDLFTKAREQATHATKHVARAVSNIVKRSATDQTVTVKGITRVGFRANIESTNIFMTGYIFFIIFVMLVVLGVVIFKFATEALVKSGKMKADKFQDFRNGWTTVLKGILFRLILIGFPQMVVLCFWELTVQDSAGEIALAVITIIVMLVMLIFVCTKVVLIARRSVALHKNPAYILYSDPVCLHKWGFLYVQFKATTYWFIIPALGYLFIEGCVVAFGQNAGTAQAIVILIIDLALLIAVSILRPYMDKKTNSFNIAIAAVNFVSAIFLLFFTDVFGLPGLVTGVMGVIFFILNAAFALILILMLLFSTGYALFSKNPDVRYQPMRDDRGSFIKSQTNLTTELDALGATARGENKTPFRTRDIDSDTYSNNSLEGNQHNGYNAMSSSTYNKESTSYDSSPFAQHDRSASMRSDMSKQRAQNTASPWQRGAGYDR